MPKLPPFALAEEQRKPRRPYFLLVFYLIFAVPLFAIHLSLLSLPYFWDELGQFIPTALDLLREGAWVARSAVPNVHPPGVEAYLVLFYRAFGYSIPITRVAMLLMASVGLLLLFLLAIRLSRGTKGAPAFLPPIFLLVSPLFYTQSMMAQLDMPAMVFTLLALLLFFDKRYEWAAIACTVLVMMKETGLVAPVVFFVVLALRKEWRTASYFAAPAVLLAAWLVALHHVTGYWLGDPGFANYNVNYSLHPVRAALTLSRRLYYLFAAEFRWIGTLALVLSARKVMLFRSREWRITLAVAAGTTLLVSLLGGAELERYLMPVLPILYIGFSIAITYQRRAVQLGATLLLAAGLLVSLYWNPPYPFPYENDLAMVDFIRLQEAAAGVLQNSFGKFRIATAWPYTAALRRSEFGYVSKPLHVLETGDFQYSSIQKLPRQDFDVLVVYSRTWSPETGVLAFPSVRGFLTRFYGWQPEITSAECATLGLSEAVSWESRGQHITIYVRRRAARV